MLAPMTAAERKILIIVTSHAELGSSGQRTGYWLEELAAPYVEFTRAGVVVDIASPRGGTPPVDPKSVPGRGAEVEAFVADGDAQRKLAGSLRVADVDPDAYAAVFLAGGHGAMWDLATDPAVARLLGRVYAGGRVVAAVCHGPGGLIGARKPDGSPLVEGHRVAGFSNDEEAAVGLVDVVPFALETRLRELGGRYEKGPNWAPFAVRDGQIVTGQNPGSSRRVALEVLAALGL